MRTSFSAALVVIALACSCRRGRDLGAKPPGLPEGSLPAGCAAVVTVDTAALGSVAEIVWETVGRVGVNGAALGGIDLRRDVRLLSYCRLSKMATGRSGFVLVVNGRIPPEITRDLLKSASEGIVVETIGGTQALGRGDVWMARRVAQGGQGELVIASGRELFRRALVGPAGTYRVEPGVAVSLVANYDQLPGVLREATGPAATDRMAIQEVALAIPVGLNVLNGRFVVGDPAIAGRLAGNLRPIVAGLANKLGIATMSSPRVSTEVEGTDVVAHIELPSGALEMFALSLQKRGPTGRRGQGPKLGQ